MSQPRKLPETFVDTPIGRLRVWASDERTLHAATMSHDHKAQPAYRDHPAARDCAEQLLVNRIPYTLYLNLVSGQHPDLERWPPNSPSQHRWAVPGADGALRLRRADSDLLPGTQAAVGRVYTLVVGAIAEWANTPAGTAFRLRAGRQALQAQIKRVSDQIAELQAQHTRLRDRDVQLALQLRDHTTPPHEGGAAR